MASEKMVDDKTGRWFYLDAPEELRPDDRLTFLLNLHGGGSFGKWQRAYFPAFQLVDSHRLVVATPTCATKEPLPMWVAEADDEHLEHVVSLVLDRFGAAIESFWLAGHSQGGMTSNRLLSTASFAGRVDGWLSLSGGRIGPIELPPSFFPPAREGAPELPTFPLIDGQRPRPGAAVPPAADLSFIFATGEHEMVGLPDTSPWAERLGAGPRVRLADVEDDDPGLVHDQSRDGRSSAAWGLAARPGRAEVYLYPGARDGRVIADVVRLDKGHTEGLEPNVTRTIVELITGATSPTA